MFRSATRRAPADQRQENIAGRWWKTGALVIGTALGLALAGAPPVVKSAQVANQLSVETETVIDQMTVYPTTVRTCAGPVCSCAAPETATGGGARCSDRDTLTSSFPANATTWTAMCQQLIEIRGAVPGTPGIAVLDIIRVPAPPANTYVVCRP
jgi:hypothetical protein